MSVSNSIGPKGAKIIVIFPNASKNRGIGYFDIIMKKRFLVYCDSSKGVPKEIVTPFFSRSPLFRPIVLESVLLANKVLPDIPKFRLDLNSVSRIPFVFMPVRDSDRVDQTN